MIRRIFFLFFLIFFLTNHNESSEKIKKLLIKSKQLLTDQEAMIVINTLTGRIEGIINKKLVLEKVARPGSTFKLVTAMVSLKKNIKNISYKLYCDDRFYILGKGTINKQIDFHLLHAKIGDYYRCSVIGGHKAMNFRNAIKKSCNIYFLNMGEKISYKLFYSSVIELGFGKKVFPHLNEENSGLIKKENNRTRQLLSFIGEGGGIMVTPLQMAFFIYYIATDGKANKISIITNNNLLFSREIDKNNRYINILSYIKEGLIKKISTSTDFFKSKVIFHSFAGKTGTSSTNQLNKSTGWFIGYAPINKPKIAFVLYLKNGSGKMAIKKMENILFNNHTQINY